jgi:hypothetical protein
MSVEDEEPRGLLGHLRTDGPSEKPPPITPRNVLAESLRLTKLLLLWSAAAGVAAGVGYLLWGATGAWASAGAVIALKVVGEPLLRAFAEST